MKIGLGAELKMVEGKLEALEKEKPELLDEIDRLRDENDNYLRAVNAKNAELENSCRELNIVIAREQSYYKELIALRKICSVEKNELYSTRAKLVELYEHYQLLETQIETKNALFQFAESTERDLKQKIHDLEVNLKSKELISEKESSQRGLLDKANQEIEKVEELFSLLPEQTMANAAKCSNPVVFCNNMWSAVVWKFFLPAVTCAIDNINFVFFVPI